MEYMEYITLYTKDGKEITNDERGKARKLSALRIAPDMRREAMERMFFVRGHHGILDLYPDGRADIHPVPFFRILVMYLST